MPSHQTRRLLPFRASQLHALVLDVESYPEFVPGYQSAHIERRSEGGLRVAQTLGLGLARVTFHSMAEYESTQWIHIEAQDGPFRRLEVNWHFCDTDKGCEVEFRVEYHLQGLLAPLMHGWLELTAPRLMDVFARRARRLYGG